MKLKWSIYPTKNIFSSFKMQRSKIVFLYILFLILTTIRSDESPKETPKQEEKEKETNDEFTEEERELLKKNEEKYLILM